MNILILILLEYFNILSEYSADEIEGQLFHLCRQLDSDKLDSKMFCKYFPSIPSIPVDNSKLIFINILRAFPIPTYFDDYNRNNWIQCRWEKHWDWFKHIKILAKCAQINVGHLSDYPEQQRSINGEWQCSLKNKFNSKNIYFLT